WRCGTPVTTKTLDQWFFKITEYADDLLKGIQQLDEWPEKVLTMQTNWIGRSEGTRVQFGEVEVFTTRVDTIFGATCVFVAPEHPLVEEWAAASAEPDVLRGRVASFRAQ